MAPRLSARRVVTSLLVTFAATAALTGLLAVAGSHLLYNGTHSAPLGLYVKRPLVRPVARGELVALRPPAAAAALIHERRYLPDGSLLLKHVVAVPGDFVCTTSGHFVAAGVDLGPLLRSDALGRWLPQHEVCGPVPAGVVYVASPAPRSFDSRNFGPVPLNAIVSRAEPVWTW